jgi:hypothetical protein
VIPKQRVARMTRDLHAILDIPKDSTRPLRLHHPSFRDFLFDKNRCRDSNFWVYEKQAHRTLAARCIELLTASLKQDICGVDSPGVLATSLESSRVEQYLPLVIQYACQYWVQHLQKSGTQLLDNDKVHQFLTVHLLHWLEALGWMRKVSDGVLAISSLESIALVSLVQHFKNIQLKYRSDMRLSSSICTHSRYKAIRSLRPTSDRAGPPTGILQCAYLRTSEEYSEEAVRRQNTWMDAKVI